MKEDVTGEDPNLLNSKYQIIWLFNYLFILAEYLALRIINEFEIHTIT